MTTGYLGPTVQREYSNSTTLLALLDYFDQWVDLTQFTDDFLRDLWDVSTAVGFGLDIWGRIVGVSRYLTIPAPTAYFGFDEAFTSVNAPDGPQPFGQAPFYNGVPTTQTYALSDEAYRALIMVKAMSNISDCAIPSLNALLLALFAGRGRCYVQSPSTMHMIYVFEFYLEPFELAILTSSGALVRPAGVGVGIMQVPNETTFGFAEAGTASAQPFGQGTFFTGIQTVN